MAYYMNDFYLEIAHRVYKNELTITSIATAPDGGQISKAKNYSWQGFIEEMCKRSGDEIVPFYQNLSSAVLRHNFARLPAFDTIKDNVTNYCQAKVQEYQTDDKPAAELAQLTDSPAVTFDALLTDKGKKLSSYLEQEYRSADPEGLAAMLFALENLTLLNISLSYTNQYNHADLYRKVKSKFSSSKCSESGLKKALNKIRDSRDGYEWQANVLPVIQNLKSILQG